MPGKVKVRILSGRNLPVMDRSNDTTDAYVEVKLGGTTFKTDVCRKSLNPHWNSEWFRFEVDDLELQDEPLQIRLMDHDTYSANDAIGKVYLDLNPLLLSSCGGIGYWPVGEDPVSGNIPTPIGPIGPIGAKPPGQIGTETHHGRPHPALISGWIPVFDTMHGIRGEVQVVVKVELFSDLNKFRQSSCGVHFFCTPAIPEGHVAQSIHGFVEELVVNDDPEYQWIDKIRTPRASNEARQTLFSKLSGEVQRKIGLKAIELGGNAVIGYQLCFDLEGESGIVVRGIGTAVTLVRKHPHPPGGTSLLMAQGRDNPMSVSVRVAHSPTAEGHSSQDDLGVGHPVVLLPQLSVTPPTPPSPIAHLFRYDSGRADRFSKKNLLRRVRSDVGTTPGLEATPKWGRLGRVLSKISLFRSESNLELRKREKAWSLPQPTAGTTPISIDMNPHNIAYSSLAYYDPACPASEPAYKQGPFSRFLSLLRSDSSLDLRKRSKAWSLPQPDSTKPSYSNLQSIDGCYTNRASSDPSALTHIRRSYSTPACKGAYFNNYQCQLGYTNPAYTYLDPVTLSKPFFPNQNDLPDRSPPPPVAQPTVAATPPSAATPVNQSEEAKGSADVPCMHRRASESDLASTPKVTSLAGSGGSAGSSFQVPSGTSVTSSTTAGGTGSGGSYPRYLRKENMDLLLEYPFLTITKFPPGFILHIGGTVSTRSVKLLERISNLEEPESRDQWWTELRMEIRSHARALCCNVVLGYTEHTSICEDVCVLSACGTAAVVSTSGTRSRPHPRARPCLPSHVPYSQSSAPIPVSMSRCGVCRKGYVPDVLLATVEPTPDLPVIGRGTLVQAQVCRQKKEGRGGGESMAKEVSDSLPFLEYELHRRLQDKLRLLGMNALFGLTVQVALGERAIVGVATGTGVRLASLPGPALPRLADEGVAYVGPAPSSKIVDLQRRLHDLAIRCRQANDVITQLKSDVVSSDTEESAGEESTGEGLPQLDLGVGNRGAYVLEVGDGEGKMGGLVGGSEGGEWGEGLWGEEEREWGALQLLQDPPIQPPSGFLGVQATEVPSGVDPSRLARNLQLFTQVWRGRIPANAPPVQFSRQFSWLMQKVYFKLRKLTPVMLSKLQFRIELPEQDELQLSVLGMAIGIGEPLPDSGRYKTKLGKSDDPEMIFTLDEDSIVPDIRLMNDPVKYHSMPKERVGVDITPLTYLPGGRIKRYVGNLNFFFIRESTSIREGGGLSGFMHSFVTEVLAIVRAHVAALGGNAMVAYFMSECVLLHNPHKNQGQCLINVGGDVVQVSYDSED